MQHVSGRAELHTGFWWGNLSESDHLEDLHLSLEGILKMLFIE
jgi:hypothetical protein